MKKNKIINICKIKIAKFDCTFIMINILAFKVKKNEINISSFEYSTDIFLSIHVELISIQFICK